MNSRSAPLICDPTAPLEPCWVVRHRNLITVVLLVLVTWSLYLPSAWHGFVYFDDVRLLRDHPELYGQATLAQDLKSIFVTAFPREEPLLLRDVAWAVQSRLFGFGNALGYHVLNILLHGIVIGLAFLFLLQLTGRYKLALATTGAWLLLAVHTEPVSWIMGSKDILSGLFMLLALCAQTRRLETGTKLSGWLWYSLTIVFVVAGLLSKVSVLTFPLVLLLHALFRPYIRGERTPEAPPPPLRVFVRESALAVPAFMASGAVYVWYGRILTQMGIFDRGYNARSWGHCWNVLVLDPLSLLVYLKQVFLPFGLSVLYTWPVCQTSYPLWQVLLALMTIALVAGTGVWLFFHRKDLFFYFAAFFVLMIPYMNLAYLGFLVADRYIYFAALFALLMAASLLTELQHRATALRVAVGVAVVIFAGDNLFQKLRYQPAWRNAETLWQYHVGLPHPSAESFANLAAYYYSQGTAAKGPSESELALRKMAVVVDAGLKEFWPNQNTKPSPEVWNLLFLRSVVQQVSGSPQDALASLLLADQLRPRFDSINLNLARLYFQLAESALDPSQKQAYAQNARDRFATYIEVTFRGRTPPPGVREEMTKMEQNYRLLSAKPSV